MRLNYSMVDTFTKETIPEEFAVNTMREGVADKLPREGEDIVKALEYLRTIENGCNAVKPLGLVVDIVKRFIPALPCKKMYPNHISPDGEGGVVLKWISDSEKVLIVFEPGLLHLAHDFLSAQEPEFKNDVVYDGGLIPQRILGHLPDKAVQYNSPKLWRKT